MFVNHSQFHVTCLLPPLRIAHNSTPHFLDENDLLADGPFKIPRIGNSSIFTSQTRMMCFGADVSLTTDSLSPSEGRNRKPHAKFTPEDDERLKSLVDKFGDQEWARISREMPGRNQRQCKERWMYYLNPSLNTTPWTHQEDLLLLEKQRELGSKWVRIAAFFHNRTDAMVKNRFQVLTRKLAKEYELRLRPQQMMSWLLSRGTSRPVHKKIQYQPPPPPPPEAPILEPLSDPDESCDFPADGLCSWFDDYECLDLFC